MLNEFNRRAMHRHSNRNLAKRKRKKISQAHIQNEKAPRGARAKGC